MTDTKLLEEVILDSGVKKGYLAKKLGLSYTSLAKKIKNISSWKACEIQIMCDELCIDVEQKEEIFFASNVDKMTTN